MPSYWYLFIIGYIFSKFFIIRSADYVFQILMQTQSST